jgi:hypothetical protein
MRTTDDNRLLIGGEDEDFVDAAKEIPLLNEKSDKLTKYLKKFYLIMISEWILSAGTFMRPKMDCPTLANIQIFQVLILFLALETASHFQLEWNLFLKC